jgi:hypothetical protein
MASALTLAHRHGPGKLKAHRMKNLGRIENEADAAFHIPDHTWDLDLLLCFDDAAVEEAHLIKTRKSAANTTIEWLDTKFTILGTAKVLPNSISDCAGYVNIIQGSTDQWSDQSLASLGVSS